VAKIVIQSEDDKRLALGSECDLGSPRTARTPYVGGYSVSDLAESASTTHVMIV
jgi:hypothetical protein